MDVLSVVFRTTVINRLWRTSSGRLFAMTCPMSRSIGTKQLLVCAYAVLVDWRVWIIGEPQANTEFFRRHLGGSP